MTTAAAQAPRPSLAILVGVTALGPMALNIFMPSMPALPAALDTDYATAQLTLSAYLGGFAVFQLVYGPVSDRFGRRPTLQVGLLLYLIGGLVCLAAASIEALIGGRVLQAIGGCAGMVLARAMVRDVYERDETASVIAYVTMAMVAVPMVAPLAGGYLDEWFGWRSIFAVTSATGALAIALSLRFLPETLPEGTRTKERTGILATYARLIRIPLFRGYAAQMSLTSAGFFAFLGGAPYVVIEVMDRPASDYGIYFAIAACGYMFGNFLSGRHAPTIGIDRLIGIGAVLSTGAAGAMVALAFAGLVTPIALFGPMVFYSLGNGLSIPTSVAGAVSVDPQAAGAASGLAGFLQMAVGGGASVLSGVVVAGADSQMPLVAVMALMTVLALAAHWATRAFVPPAGTDVGNTADAGPQEKGSIE